MSEFAEFMTTPVTWWDVDAYGNKTADPHTARGLVEHDTHLVIDVHGREVTCGTRVYLPAGTGVQVGQHMASQADPEARRVVKIERYTAGTVDLPGHEVVHLL